MRPRRRLHLEPSLPLVEVWLVVAMAGLLLGIGYWISRGDADPVLPHNTAAIETAPPLKLKNAGILLDRYDPATLTAGDLVFTKGQLADGRVFTEYGYRPAGGQPLPYASLRVPLDTPVRSLVDGEVVAVDKLVEGGYRIQLAARSDSAWRYELLHVGQPRVRTGAEVTAGQVIAAAGRTAVAQNSGLGTVSMGLQHRLPSGAYEQSSDDQADT